VSAERFDDRLFQVSGGGASGVQDGQQRQGLTAVSVLRQSTLPELRHAERGVDLLGPGVEVVDPAATFERGSDPGAGELGRCAGCGCDREDRGCFAAGDAAFLLGEDLQERREVFPQQRPQLVAYPVQAPDGVLVSAGQYGHGFGMLGIGRRANAQLKTWKILTKLRCCPHRAGHLAKAIHVLHNREASA
jgi:hypothetical protein